MLIGLLSMCKNDLPVVVSTGVDVVLSLWLCKIEVKLWCSVSVVKPVVDSVGDRAIVAEARPDKYNTLVVSHSISAFFHKHHWF